MHFTNSQSIIRANLLPAKTTKLQDEVILIDGTQEEDILAISHISNDNSKKSKKGRSDVLSPNESFYEEILSTLTDYVFDHTIDPLVHPYVERTLAKG